MSKNVVNMAKWSDAELFQALHQEHKFAEQAFTEIYNRYSRPVFAYIFRVLQDRTESKDIFQETFLRFFNFAKKNETVSNVLYLLIKIARNLCLNNIRDKKINIPFEDYRTYDEVINPLEHEDVATFISKALELLDFEVREIFILHHYHQLTFVEISSITGESLASIKTRYYRGKEKLKKFLTPIFKDYYKI
ncbi:MAG: RNA polymerase sigma factor [Candidatus Kapaibacteriales bacterium]